MTVDYGGRGRLSIEIKFSLLLKDFTTFNYEAIYSYEKSVEE